MEILIILVTVPTALHRAGKFGLNLRYSQRALGWMFLLAQPVWMVPYALFPRGKRGIILAAVMWVGMLLFGGGFLHGFVFHYSIIRSNREKAKSQKPKAKSQKQK